MSTKKNRHAQLFEAAQDAYAWLSDAPEETDQRERAENLRLAMLRFNMDITCPRPVTGGNP